MRNCPACQRPVRAREGACPFCAAAMPAGIEGGALQKAAIGSAIAVAAATMSGCPVYGAPPMPAPSASASASAGPSPAPSASAPVAQPLYGAPMPPSAAPSAK